MTQNNSPWQYEARTTARQSRWQLARREKRVCCFFLKIDLIYHTPKKKPEYTDTQWQLSPLLLRQWDLAQLVAQPCLQAEVFVAKNFMNEFTKRFTLPRTSSPSSGTCFSRTNHLWKAHTHKTLTIAFLARKFFFVILTSKEKLWMDLALHPRKLPVLLNFAPHNGLILGYLRPFSPHTPGDGFNTWTAKNGAV